MLTADVRDRFPRCGACGGGWVFSSGRLSDMLQGSLSNQRLLLLRRGAVCDFIPFKMSRICGSFLRPGRVSVFLLHNSAPR